MHTNTTAVMSVPIEESAHSAVFRTTHAIDQPTALPLLKSVLEGTLGRDKSERDCFANSFRSAFKSSGTTGEELLLSAINESLAESKSGFRIRFGIWIDDDLGELCRAVEVLDCRIEHVTDRMTFSIAH